jgi:type I restriction enzyme, S subunit
MEVKPGYKQTEVGVIPEAWDCVAVQTLVDENILEKPLDGNHGNIHPKSSDFVDYGIPFVMANNFLDGQVDLLGCKFITKERAAKLQKGFSIAGDVLLTHKGTVGNTAIVPELNVHFIMLTPQVTYYRLRDENRLNNGFLRQYFDSQPFQSLFKSLAGGGTRAYLGIVKQLALPIIKPPIDEQRAISATLSDVDALLGGLDRLITKKRDLKQAAIQQLLTGQTRLHGFHGEWVVKELGQLGSISGAGVDKKIRPGEPPVRLVNYMDVYRRSFIRSKDLDYVVSASPDQAARCAVRKGDVFFTPSSEMPFDIAASAVATEDIPDACYSYHVVRLRLDEDWDISFRAYAFKSQAFLDQAARTSEGSGVRYVITQGRFRQLTIRFPSDKAEQAAIGAVLSDMDAELAALESRRDKTRDLKQAMMQELLTGKTRLVSVGDAHA